MLSNKKMTHWVLLVALFVSILFPAGAGAAAGDVNSIEFDSASKVELTVGQTPKQLKVLATVEGSSSKRDITAAAVWTSSDTGVVTVSSGLLTPKGSGSAIIKATYNNSVATIEVSVSYPYKNLKLEHEGSGSYKLGDSGSLLQVTATIAGGDSETAVNDVTEDAEWSSSNGNVLTVSDGLLKLVGEGSATIAAKYKGLTASFKATVALPYSGLEIRSGGAAVDELEMLIGDDAVSLSAFTKASEQSDVKNVTADAKWTSSNTSAVTVENGAIKAIGIGKATIKADYLGVSQSVDVYVRAPYEALLLTPSGDQTLFIGETLKMKAEVRDAANSTIDVTSDANFSLDNKLAAALSTGTETVITAKAAGTSAVKAEYKGSSKSFKLTVYPTLSAMKADSTKLELYTGDTAGLPKVSGTKLDESTVDINQEIEWTSANEDIAMIKDGKISAVSAGTVHLTGKWKEAQTVSSKADFRSKSVDVVLTVKDKVLVLIGPEDDLGLVAGEEAQLPEVNAVMENGDEKDVTDEIAWTLSGSNAVIKQTSSGKVIKGLVKGSATLKGTYSNKSISIPVKIEQKIVKITVDPAVLEMNIKNTKSIKATGYTAAGKTVNLSSVMNWTSSDTAVVSVKGASIKALAEGTASLSGSYQGISVTVKVSVVPKLTKLKLSENRFKLSPGSAASVSVTAEYDTGKTASVTGSVVWTSSKLSVASISQSGAIAAYSKGTAVLKGKFGGKTVSVTVTVK
ncbi:hypothetical protein SAMN04487895_109203 [Paenibacillus sophorae]|uniref:BIG2 domain-containing protein n=1 Tax=Paenibacillus sophorae TaxID=1333845 RepID=A0A1H8R9X6_9BACL|nr:hypothetical protein [Paenibacillus sophorae]QWU15001.1 hypothetical protein KP014_24340 [Paenibacillus sophorae]SEO63107.1 hypothetical protein SAMN04487895_109203 [Paenibacillus sophorae]